MLVDMETDRKGQPETAAPSGVEQTYDLLEELAGTIRESAKTLTSALDGRVAPPHAWKSIRDLDHKGDAIARDLFEILTVPGAADANTESLQALTGYLDDVLDAIEAAAAGLAIHLVKRVFPSAREMGEIVMESANELGQAIG